MISRKAGYSWTNCRRQWDSNPGPLCQQASAKPTELPKLLHIDHKGMRRLFWLLPFQACIFQATKVLLYKCTILTAMMHRLTRVLFCHSFRKLMFQVNKINHKNVVKRGMYRMCRLSLVFAIRTCYTYMYSPTRSRPYVLCDQIHFVDSSWSKNCLCEWGRLSSNPTVFYLNSQWSVCVCGRIKWIF